MLKAANRWFLSMKPWPGSTGLARVQWAAEFNKETRIALGTRLWELSNLRLVLLGIVIGVAGAVALTRWMDALLFEVNPTDPFTLIAIAVVVLGVSLISCYFPARRAVRMDPLLALREE